MENIKSKIIVAVAMAACLLLCAVGYRVFFIDSTHYYVRIDNSAVKQLGRDEYEYNLTTYDEHGKMRDMTFKATKELREGVYLELDVMFVRGVVNWREVQPDELPLDTRTRLLPDK